MNIFPMPFYKDIENLKPLLDIYCIYNWNSTIITSWKFGFVSVASVEYRAGMTTFVVNKKKIGGLP